MYLFSETPSINKAVGSFLKTPKNIQGKKNFFMLVFLKSSVLQDQKIGIGENEKWVQEIIIKF